MKDETAEMGVSAINVLQKNKSKAENVCRFWVYYKHSTLGARDFSSAVSGSVKSLRGFGLRPTPKIAAMREKNL